MTFSTSMELPDITVVLGAASESIFDQAYQHFNEQSTPRDEQPSAPAPYSAPYDRAPYDQAPNDSALERASQAFAQRETNAQTDAGPGFNLDQVDVGLLVSEPSLVLALAVLIEMLIPLPKKLKLSGLSSVFAGLARKVNRTGFSNQQRAFAGVMLPTLIVSVLLFLVLTLDLIAGFDLLVALVVLVLVLELRFAQEGSVQVERAWVLPRPAPKARFCASSVAGLRLWSGS